MICLDCGHILEFRHDEIERLQDEIASKNGFVVSDHKMVIYASCKKVPCPHRTTTEKAR